MKRNELRPCIVKIDKIDIETEKIEGTEVREALFHMWYEWKIGDYKELLAIVEYEDGSMHFVKPSEITFTDRDCKKINKYSNIKWENQRIENGVVVQQGTPIPKEIADYYMEHKYAEKCIPLNADTCEKISKLL